MCFRRGKNLADSLVRARLPESETPDRLDDPVTLRMAPSFEQHSTRCGTAGCKCCAKMSGKERIFSSSTSYRTPKGTSCNSHGVVYHLECSRCRSKNVYVGQTSRPLGTRIAGHRAAHRNKKSMPLYKHLGKPGHSFKDLKITVLQLVRPPTEFNLLQEEQKWITRLNTKLPWGLNSQFS